MEILSNFFEQSLLIGVLALAIYFLYKVEIKKRDEKIEELQARIEEKNAFIIEFLKERESDVLELLKTLEQKITK